MTTLHTYPLIKKPFKKMTANKLWILATIFAMGLFLPNIVFAASMWDKVAVMVGQLMYLIMIAPVTLILRLELWILPMIASYNDFTRENGVVVGWTALRDLANMFFILILLIISFATIMRIQRFGYRQLLSKLIIMAILINFSMTITGLLIDISQVVMLTFVDAIKGVTAGNIMVSLGLGNLLSLGESGTSITGVNYIKAVFLAAIMLLITVVVVGAFMMLLAGRIVKIWILLVVSPMVFLAYAFPLTEKYYNQWVDELTKTLVSGPTLAFFLWLSFTITGRGDISSKFTNLGPPGDIGSEISAGASTPNVVNYIIGIAMLIGALQFASQQSSAAAAFSAKAKGLGKKLGGGAARRVWQGGRSAGGQGGVKGVIGSATGAAAGGLRNLGVKLQGRDTETGKQKEGKGAAVASRVFGRAGRMMEGAGIRGQAANAARDTARDTALQDMMKNMSPAEQARYLELRGGKEDKNRVAGRFGGGDSAKRLSIQTKLDSGHYDTEEGAKDLEKDFKFLQERGGVSSHQTMSKMQSKYAILDDSSATDIEKEIASGKVESVDFSGATQKDADGNVVGVNENARRKMETLVDKMDTKELQALFDRLNKRQQDAFNEVLGHIESEDKSLEHGFDTSGNIDKDSKAHKARMFIMNNDAKGATALFDKIAQAISSSTDDTQRKRHETMRDSLATARSGSKFNTATLLKAEADSSYVRAMAPHLTAGQLNTVASEGTREQRQQIVRDHIDGGGQNLSTIMATKPLADFVQNLDIKQNFQQQIQSQPNSDAKSEMAVKLAKANLEFAGEVFPDPKDLAKFINENLKVDEAIKIETKLLNKAWMHLSASMRSALEKKGITGSEGDSGSSFDGGGI